MDLKLLIKSLTSEALEFIFVDAMKRGEDENARIISDEILRRDLL